MKYIVRDTIPVWVTWNYEVEANSHEDAIESFRNGNWLQLGELEIGDSLDGYDAILHRATSGIVQWWRKCHPSCLH